VRSGLYSTLSLPGIPGLEAVGVVDALSATPHPVAPLEDSMRIAYLLTAMALATATAGAEDLEAWLNQISQKVPANFFVQRF